MIKPRSSEELGQIQLNLCRLSASVMASQGIPGQGDVSKHALSMVMKKKNAEECLFLLGYYKYLVAVFLPLAIATIVMSCLFADIQGKRSVYTDVSENWESCLTTADNQYIEISVALASAKNNFALCLFDQHSCNSTCVISIATNCAIGGANSPSTVTLPSGHLLSGLSFLGISSVIYGVGAHVAIIRALTQPTWLISTIAAAFWACFAILTYYTLSPVLPVPGQTNSTLLSMLYYERSYNMYDGLNGGDNQCRTAFTYVWLYLIFQVLIAFTVFLGGCIAIYAEQIRYRSSKQYAFERLEYTTVPVILAGLACLFYVLVVISKIISMITEVHAISSFNLTPEQAFAQGKLLWYEPIWFPFAQPSFDLGTVLGVAAFMSILRGFTVQSITAFRIAAVTSMLFTLVSYPAVVGAFAFYKENDFKDYDKCWNYFLASDVVATFGYPDENQAKLYCTSFRLALASTFAFFVVCHLITIACFLMIRKNVDRESFAHETLVDFTDLAVDLWGSDKETQVAQQQQQQRSETAWSTTLLGASYVNNNPILDGEGGRK